MSGFGIYLEPINLLINQMWNERPRKEAKTLLKFWSG